MSMQKQAARVRGLFDGSLRDPRRLAINATHSMYYRSVIRDTHYHGVQILKSPLDLWVYQEILFSHPVDVVVETGTFSGGSALYLAHLMDQLGRGRILSIDIEGRADLPLHPRIEYLTGPSTSPDMVERVRKETAGAEVLVVLDSDPAQSHVLDEMKSYADLVKPGGYMIVEDGNVNGHPVFVDHGPGPQEAIREFLSQRADFVIDKAREKFLLTMNPNGYLRRIG